MIRLIHDLTISVEYVYSNKIIVFICMFDSASSGLYPSGRVHSHNY